jgi:uncharacterized membrane protein YkvA (DUF1232 family)
VARITGVSFFGRALRHATALAVGNRPVGRLLAAAAALLGRNPVLLRRVRADAGALVRMAREALAGRYRALPKRALVACLAAVIYLVNPLDLVPDVLPALGWIDDGVVIAWVVSQIRRDVDAFLAWEREWGGAIDVRGSEVPPPALPTLPTSTGGAGEG